MNLPNLRRLADEIGLVLVSGSPRRKRILTEAGLTFDVVLPEADEQLRPELSPEQQAMDLAGRKVMSVRPSDRRAYLGCDTIVVVEGEIMTKPADADDAVRILKKLSGSDHTVISGLALYDPGHDRLHQTYEQSRVHFNDLDDDAVRRYIATGEPLDKAGAYGIQGMGAFLVDTVEGNVDNVIGLPMCALEQLATLFWKTYGR